MRGSNPTNQFKKNCLKAVAGAVALSLTPFVAGTAMAQTNILEEITVTAQRREENLSEVPISISAIQGDDAHTWFESGEDVRALAARVPSLYVESSNGRLAPRFYMRGLGNTDFDLAASQSVSVIVDEVVQENVILKSFPIFDIDRIEVLRGPQGTLFGRNTPAGIVKFDTRKPSEDLNGYAYASFGTYGTMNIEGALGGAFNQSGTLQGRLSVLSQNRNDWISNGYTGEEDVMGGYNEMAWRGQLLWAPTDGFSGLVNVHGRKLDGGTASIFRANILSTGNNALNGNFVRDEVYFDEGDNNPQEADGLGGSLKLEFDFGNDMTLTSITAVESVDNRSLGDIDGGNVDFGPGFIPFPSATEDGIAELSQTTQEFRLAHQATDALFWQAGIFYFTSDISITTNPFFVPPTTIKHQNTAYAAFGHVSYDFTDRFTVIAGLRYTDDQKDMTATAGNVTDPITVDDSKTSWDLSGHFTISDTVNLYARLANGFRAPTIQARDVAFFGPASVAKSETINSAEFGIKSTHLDDHIRLSAAVYVYKIDDMQLSAIGGEENTVQLINAEQGNGSGFDMDAEFLVTDNLYVSLGLSYNNTEIDDAGLRVAPCGSGQCTIIDELDAEGNAIVNGNPFPQAPPTMINFALKYTKPVDTGNVFFHTDWTRQGDTTFFLYDSNEYHSGSIYEGGLRLGYSHGDEGNWEVALFGRNITDEENLKGGIDFNNNTGFVNEPRTWGATFKINFGE